MSKFGSFYICVLSFFCLAYYGRNSASSVPEETSNLWIVGVAVAAVVIVIIVIWVIFCFIIKKRGPESGKDGEPPHLLRMKGGNKVLLLKDISSLWRKKNTLKKKISNCSTCNAKQVLLMQFEANNGLYCVSRVMNQWKWSNHQATQPTISKRGSLMKSQKRQIWKTLPMPLSKNLGKLR